MASLNDQDADHLDLVPMIDCIMLLLLFFMMTSKFSSEEKAIASLLPTDLGGGGSGSAAIELPKMVNIRLYPAGLRPDLEPIAYDKDLRQRIITEPILKKAWLQIGQREPLELDGTQITQKGGKAMQAQVELIHQRIKEELKAFEAPNAPRHEQAPIIIHCFSGLSWKFALLTFDAVRAYEVQAPGAIKYEGDPEQLKYQRPVTFAPPRVRNFSPTELGEELRDIVNMR
jgi:hypothetical protein